MERSYDKEHPRDDRQLSQNAKTITFLDPWIHFGKNDFTNRG